MSFDKLELGRCRDLTADNVRRIGGLFPDCVVESRDSDDRVVLSIDFEVLKAHLSSDIVDPTQSERYQMNWPGKAESRNQAYTPIDKTLRPVVAESKNFDTTENIFIEGDNLDALKLLQESYLGKVKMIYIDPPYNTGKDFIYKDNLKQDKAEYDEGSDYIDEDGGRLVANPESNGRYHSDWLSMMYPRLLLARNLLKDDGVIFISIDDNEQANLKKVCDEVFGESNTLINTIWLKGNAQNDAKNIQKNHEYILGYARNIEYLNIKEMISNEYVAHEDKKGVFYLGAGLTTGGAGGTLNNRPLLGYTIYYNNETKDKIAVQDYDIKLAKTSNDENIIYSDNHELLKQGYCIIRPPKKGNNLGCWTWSIDKFNKKKDTIYISDKHTIIKKEYVENPIIENEKVIINKASPLRSVCEVTSSKGTKTMNSIMGTKVFDNPKSIELLQRFIKNTMHSNGIILDFFAGSGTTAHAVMALNAEDGGQRRCICVQLPEVTDEKSEAFKAGYKNIADITKERIRRAGDKIISDNANSKNPKDLPPLDTGFRVFKVDSGNYKPVQKTANDTTQAEILDLVENIKPDRSDIDLLFDVLLAWGVQLDHPIEKYTFDQKTVYSVYDKNDKNKTPFLMACFADNITETMVTQMTKHTPHRVVFRDTCFNNNDSLRINTETIFKTHSPTTEIKVI